MAIFLTKANRFAFCWLDSLLKIAGGVGGGGGHQNKICHHWTGLARTKP